MPDRVEQPRDYAAAQITRATEPYHFQRDRQTFNKQPRPAQANTSQPNARSAPVGWGLSTNAYWQSVMSDYLKRKNMSQNTSLRMGREL